MTDTHPHAPGVLHEGQSLERLYFSPVLVLNTIAPKNYHKKYLFEKGKI